GAKFTLTLKKASCNVGSTELSKTDDHCYYHNKIWNGDIPPSYHTSCSLGKDYCDVGCSYCDESSCAVWAMDGSCISSICTHYAHTPDSVCKSAYEYDHIYCNDAAGIVNPPVTSTIEPSNQTFTLGADSSGREKTSEVISNSSNFTC